MTGHNSAPKGSDAGPAGSPTPGPTDRGATEEPATVRPVRNGDVVLTTQAFGPADGVPLVLAMGATASMLWWPEALCEELAGRGFRVVRYDNRDTGQSTSWPPGEADYAAEDMAEDLLAVLDGHGFASAHLAGMSLGGYVAQMLSIDHPARVRSLTLIGAEPLGGAAHALPGIDDRFLAHFAGFPAVDWSDRTAAAAFLMEIARLSAGSGHGFDEEATARRIAGELDRAADIRSAFNHGQVGTRRDWTGAAASLTVPVLVLHGEEDPILPLANGEAIARLAPDARLVVLRGTGHELCGADLPLIARTIADFALAAERR